MAFKPMLSQIQGGVELRSDVDTLKASYAAAKVITEIAKEEGTNYNAEELFNVLKSGVESVDGKITEAIKVIKDKAIKDVVRMQLIANYANGAFSVSIPADLEQTVPQVDKTSPVFVYDLDGSSVMGTDGSQVTLNLETGTFSAIPADLDKANSTEDTLVYVSRTKSFEFKIFPVGSFTFDTLPENYLLDNSELQLAVYDKVIDEVIVRLTKDKALIDAISKLVGSQAVSEQIDVKVEAVKTELNQTISANKTSADATEAKVVALTKTVEDNKTETDATKVAFEEYKASSSADIKTIQGYVKETGLDANSKIVINVADGKVEQDSKEAVNGGQLFSIDTAYKASDNKLQVNIDTLSQNVETNHEALSERVKTLEDAKPVSDAKIQKNADDIAKLNASTVSINVPEFHVQSFDLTSTATTEFALESVPNASKVTVNVNGLVYEEDDLAFTVSRDAKTLTWAFTSANDGFDLKDDVADKIFVRFYEDKTVTVNLALPKE